MPAGRAAAGAPPDAAARWWRRWRGQPYVVMSDACVAPSGRCDGADGGVEKARAVLCRREPVAAHREARVEVRERTQRRLRDRLFVVRGLRLDLHADVLETALVGEFGQRSDGLEPDFLLFPLQHGQHGVDDFVITQSAQGPHHHRHRAGRGGLQHFHQARHGAFAADFGQRVDGAFADPPILVLGRVDQVTDGAIVLGLVQDLDGRAPDVFVLVAHQVQHGFDHLRAADLAEGVGGARAYPPVVV